MDVVVATPSSVPAPEVNSFVDLVSDSGVELDPDIADE